METNKISTNKQNKNIPVKGIFYISILLGFFFAMISLANIEMGGNGIGKHVAVLDPVSVWMTPIAIFLISSAVIFFIFIIPKMLKEKKKEPEPEKKNEEIYEEDPFASVNEKERKLQSTKLTRE